MLHEAQSVVQAPDSVYLAGTALVFLLSLLLLLLVRHYLTIPGGIPPGPLPLPVLGNLPLLDRERPYESLRQMSVTFGSDVISVWMGNQLTVILNSYRSVREALVTRSDVFSVRPYMYLLELTAKRRGIIMADGEKWKEHRRFTLSTLKDFGFGKQSIEVLLQDESSDLLEQLRAASKDGRDPVDMREYLNYAILNVICRLLLGERFNKSNVKIHTLVEQIHENEKIIGARPELNFMPYLRHLPGFSKYPRLVAEHTAQHELIFQHFIDQHRQTLDRDHPRDYLDAYITRSDQLNDKRGVPTHMNDMELIHCIGDMFAAGSDTTSITLYWAVLYLLHNPHIQTKIHDEIDAVIGRTKLPTLKHKGSLPYTEAVIMEVQRMACIVPLGVMHGTLSDTTLLGYNIPKGTCIFPNLWSVSRDEKLWPQPDTFDPNRFLDSNGKLQRPEHFIPFSMGPRTCLGEALAKQELFIFFTSLMQQFTFMPSTPGELPSTGGIMSMILSPNDFTVLIQQR